MTQKNMIAIDLSLRSTGIIRLTEKNEILDFKIISNKKLNYEELLVWNANEILKFCEKKPFNYIVFEGLSFKSKSKYLDFINGNFWHARCMIRKRYGDEMPIGAIPVLSWRNKILSKEELKEAGKIKTGLKIAVVDKLEKNIKNIFDEYIKINKKAKKSIYDLADAYYIGVYRNSLENDKNKT